MVAEPSGNGFARWILALAAALAVAGIGGTVSQYGRASSLGARMDNLEEHRRELRNEIHSLEERVRAMELLECR